MCQPSTDSNTFFFVLEKEEEENRNNLKYASTLKAIEQWVKLWRKKKQQMTK